MEDMCELMIFPQEIAPAFDSSLSRLLAQ